MLRRPPLRPLVLLLLFGLMAVGCGREVATSTGRLVDPPADASVPFAEPAPAVSPDQAEQAGLVEQAGMVEQAAGEELVNPTADPAPEFGTSLPPATIGFDDLYDSEPMPPRPVSIEIENIDVLEAEIIPVGVNDDLSLEVPPADQVGWYEFGPVPGEPGSAVLAAHIAYDGIDGVFRFLEDVDTGSIVVIGFDDGSQRRYRIEEVAEYVKDELPDTLFDRGGREQLALITCGGAFNEQLDSYDSNTVAIAVPLS